MRRIAALLLIPLLTLAACGGDGDDTTADGGGGLPSVTGAGFGSEPTIGTDGSGPEELTTKVLTEGDGEPVEDGDVLVADFKGQLAGAGTVVADTYTVGQPLIRTIGTGQTIPGFDEAIPGKAIGSRVLLVVPPEQGFGQAGQPAAGIAPDDSLVFVVDILDAFRPDTTASGEATDVELGDDLPAVRGDTDPKITIPDSDPPEDLVQKVLRKGDGQTVQAGQTIAVHYTGVNWRSRKQFDSSWDRDGGPTPTGFPIGQGGLIEGFDKGLVGKTVGSRVLLVIPPELGYGSAGRQQAGIKGTDTLVFVVDILGAYG